MQKQAYSHLNLYCILLTSLYCPHTQKPPARLSLFFFLYFVNSECLCMQKGTGSACSVLQMQHAEAKQIEILTNLHFISLIRSLTSSPAQLQYHSLDFGPGIFQRSAKHLDNFIILHKQYTKKKNTFVYYPVYNTENK